MITRGHLDPVDSCEHPNHVFTLIETSLPYKYVND